MDACSEIDIKKGERVCNEGDIGNEFFSFISFFLLLIDEII